MFRAVFYISLKSIDDVNMLKTNYLIFYCNQILSKQGIGGKFDY